MQEQYEQEESEREREQIVAEEEAKKLQRRLKRLQEGEHIAVRDGLGGDGIAIALHVAAQIVPDLGRGDFGGGGLRQHQGGQRGAAGELGITEHVKCAFP